MTRSEAAADFVLANTRRAAAPLLPEIALHLADEVTPLWEATEASLARQGLPPPFWAFAWVGGQAVARWVLDNPGAVAGRRVVDFAAGSGLCAIAAARAGAARVAAAEIDPFAAAAIALNAAANGVAIELLDQDMVGTTLPDTDIILAGDVCYEKPMTDRVLPWLRDQARRGRMVVLGDPGRAYRPRDGIVHLARYTVPTSTAIESSETRETDVWRLLPE